jgi:hypothetical protein
MTYAEIMDLLPVAKGTLAGWCKDILLSDEEIKARVPSQKGVPRDTQRRRRAEIEAIRSDAAVEAAERVHDPFWIAGVVRYWAEGTKAKPRLELTNSDPRALRLFISWTRRFHLPEAEFVLELHLHEGNDDTEARLFGHPRSASSTLRSTRPSSSQPEPVTERTILFTESVVYPWRRVLTRSIAPWPGSM